MSIVLYTGRPGSGKSCKMAQVALDLLRRNEAWRRKTGEVRKVASNMRFADWVRAKYPDGITEWTDLEQVVQMQGVDLLIDEVANLLDANNWANLPLSVKVFLRHHEKRGVAIYATTQNFPAVDVQFRRLVSELYECSKVFGSARPGPRMPPVRRVWGLIWLTHYDPATYDSPQPKRMGLSLGSWCWIDSELVSAYDTLQEIPPGKFAPLKHAERHCIECGEVRVVHS